MHANARRAPRSVIALVAIGLALSCRRSPSTSSGGADATSSDGGVAPTAAVGRPLLVASASDLARTLPTIAAAFESAHGTHVEPTFGASGMLAKQLARGAPFDVFLSADGSFVDDAIASGACLRATKRTYARGHLALWSKDEALRPNVVLDLLNAKYKRIAIANPEHAPYGRAARQALVSAGIWSRVEPRIVYGENVGQTLAFAQTGNAEVAIVARSLVDDDMAHARDVDTSLHEPLDQWLVVCRGGGGADRAGAQAFADFMQEDPAQAILEARGFSTGHDEPKPTP